MTFEQMDLQQIEQFLAGLVPLAHELAGGDEDKGESQSE